MARDRIEIDIDGISYSYRQLSPTKATLLFLKLVKIFGPVLGKAFSEKILSGGKPGVNDLDIDLKNMPLEEMIEVITDRMDEVELMGMARKLLSDTAATSNMSKKLGDPTNFDNHFDETPGMLHMFLVIKEVLVLQYADFFAGLGMSGNLKPPSPATNSPMVP